MHVLCSPVIQHCWSQRLSNWFRSEQECTGRGEGGLKFLHGIKLGIKIFTRDRGGGKEGGDGIGGKKTRQKQTKFLSLIHNTDTLASWHLLSVHLE